MKDTKTVELGTNDSAIVFRVTEDGVSPELYIPRPDGAKDDDPVDVYSAFCIAVATKLSEEVGWFEDQVDWLEAKAKELKNEQERTD